MAPLAPKLPLGDTRTGSEQHVSGDVNMGHHYLPQFYLKGFSRASGNRIWVYDKQDARKFVTQVKSVANESGFYSQEVEQFLANAIEEPANEVLEKIRQRGLLNDDDKELLAKYMAAMMMRVPRGKERIKEKGPSVASKFQEEIDQQLAVAAEHPEKAEFIERRKAQIEQILHRFGKDPPKQVWLDNIPPARSPQIVAALRSMTWRFLTFDRSPAFLTCDNPVFYFTWMGIGRRESEVTFPISSHVTLWATRRTDVSEGYTATTIQAVGPTGYL